MQLYVILNEVKDLSCRVMEKEGGERGWVFVRGCLMLRSFATEAQDDKLTVTLKLSGNLDQTPSSPLLAKGGGRRGWVFCL